LILEKGWKCPLWISIFGEIRCLRKSRYFAIAAISEANALKNGCKSKIIWQTKNFKKGFDAVNG